MTRGLLTSANPSAFICGLAPLAKVKITKRTHLSFFDLFVNTTGYSQRPARSGKKRTHFETEVQEKLLRRSMFPGPQGTSKSRYFPWFLLSKTPETRIGIRRRCHGVGGPTIVLKNFEKSSEEFYKKQFDRIGNRMDHLMIVMAAGKTLIVSSDGRGNEVVGCKKLVTRTGVQQPATKPKRQQLYFTHATPLEK